MMRTDLTALGKSRTKAVCGWRPDAADMVILAGGQRIQMRRVHPAGLFAGTLEGPDIPDYRLEVSYPDGTVVEVDDPYRFWLTVGELDLHRGSARTGAAGAR